jgi:hypothetical protein
MMNDGGAAGGAMSSSIEGSSIMNRLTPALLVAASLTLAGCAGGVKPPKGDEVSPDLPRVTIEVKGMT